MIFDIEKMAADIMAMPLRKWKERRFSDLGALKPEEEDPDVVFRNNWLAKGQVFGLVAGSGIGKSSLTVQAAYHWAIGSTFLASPMHPLKIAVVQAEDSDRDLKEQREGMIRGLTELCGWTSEQIAAADANIVIPSDFVGRSGKDFMNLLRDFQGDTHQDLIVINPLQSFFGGDVNSQEDAYEFANALDAIIKHEDLKCVAGLVMHTAKWKSGQRDGRQDVNDFAEYIMAGSHAWTDWLRAILAFQKHGNSETYFDLKAAKRGKRLGWLDANGELTTSKIFKHSDGFIFWQEVTDADEIAAIPEPEQRDRGAPKKEAINIAKAASTVATNYRETFLGKTRPKAVSALWEQDGKKHTKADWEKVYDYIVENAQSFDIQVRDVVYDNGKKYKICF